MTSIQAGIAVRFWLWAVLLRPLKHVLPFETLVRLMRTSRRGPERRPAVVDAVKSYMNATGRFPFRPPSNCLERSLGAYRLLAGAGASPMLVIGVRRSPEGGIDGHVWVMLDGTPFGESVDGLSAYTPLVTFDVEGRQTHPAGAPMTLAGVRFS